MLYVIVRLFINNLPLRTNILAYGYELPVTNKYSRSFVSIRIFSIFYIQSTSRHKYSRVQLPMTGTHEYSRSCQYIAIRNRRNIDIHAICTQFLSRGAIYFLSHFRKTISLFGRTKIIAVPMWVTGWRSLRRFTIFQAMPSIVVWVFF